MRMLYFLGIITLENYKIFCEYNNLTLEKTVFIFPGNIKHNLEQDNLFSIKSGSGLAEVAEKLGKNGSPTLSLPTIGMDDWLSSDVTQNIAKMAIKALWRAIGAGFNIVLPVRDHSNDTYFSRALNNTNFEPNFWGGVQFQPNKELADYYTLNLNLLAKFLESNIIDDNKDKEDLLHAYEEGKSMANDDPWLSK